MKRGSTRKHPQQQTTPRKKKASSSRAVVSWASSPTKIPTTDDLPEAGSTTDEQHAAAARGRDIADELSLLVSQPPTLVSAETFSTAIGTEEADEDAKEDEATVSSKQTSIFEKWTASEPGPKSIDTSSIAMTRTLQDHGRQVESAAPEDELMKALNQLASDIRPISECTSQMSQIPLMSQQMTPPPPLVAVVGAAPAKVEDVIPEQPNVKSMQLSPTEPPASIPCQGPVMLPSQLDDARRSIQGPVQRSPTKATGSQLTRDIAGQAPWLPMHESPSAIRRSLSFQPQRTTNILSEGSTSRSHSPRIRHVDLPLSSVLHLKETKVYPSSPLHEEKAHPRVMTTFEAEKVMVEMPVENCQSVDVSDADMFLAAACSMAETNALIARNVGKLPEQSASCSTPGKHFARFKVIHVEEFVLEESTGEMVKILRAMNRMLQREYTIQLLGRWVDAPVCANDTINIVWTEPTPRDMESQLDQTTIVVDDLKNFLIVRPDVLVSPTRIADANSCLRRAVLSERLAIETPSRDTVLGHMKHSLFQLALRAGNFGEEFISSMIPSVVSTSRSVEDLFRLGMCEEDAIAELNRSVKTFARWGEMMFGFDAPGEVLTFGVDSVKRVRVLKVVATEEMMWSPMWGLKGALDVTAVVGMTPLNQEKENPLFVGEERAVLPLELKTGRQGPEKSEHRAQVMLYALMVADRYAASTLPSKEGGILIRAPTIEGLPMNSLASAPPPLITTGIRVIHLELRELIMIRNRIAVNTTTSIPRNAGGPRLSAVAAALMDDSDEREKLPGVTRNVTGECSRCFQRDTCTLVHVAVESGSRDTMNVTQEDHDKALGALSQGHLQYFARWNKILECEGRRSTSNQKHVWTRVPIDRERLARTCIAGLSLKVAPETDVASVFNTIGSSLSSPNEPLCFSSDSVVLEFSRSSPPIVLGELNLAVGDLVLLSVEGAHYHVSKGHIVAMQSNVVTVRAQNFPCRTEDDLTTLMNKPWCIDRVDILWGNRFLQGTLAAMFVQVRSRSQSSPALQRSATVAGVSPSKRKDEHDIIAHQQNLHKERMRSLIIDLKPPRFIDHANEPGKRFIRDCDPTLLQDLLMQTDSLSTVRRGLAMKKVPPSVVKPFGEAAMKQRRASLDLNVLTRDQLNAVAATLAAEDYLCIIGAPGAGKTTTIAFVVHMLHELGKSVLVSSFTHSACDNLLLKIKSRGVNVLRIGVASNVRKELKDSTLTEEATSVAELEKHLENPRLVCGATCLGVKHALIQRKMFDYCIVDEAGQLAEIVALGPLARARCTIFVGDPKQLPPLVVSPEAKALGMERSLFERLVERHPHAVVALTTQFRMNAEINDLANELFYNGQLACGSDGIAKQRLALPFLARCFQSESSQPSWLFKAVDPSLPVVFVDTDGLGPGVARETRRARAKRIDVDDEAKDDEEESTIVNVVEALLVHLMVDRFARSGLPLRNIGVISPYRSQLKALRARLVEAVEVDTVDKFQGRDKDCIIVSMVRSNANKVVGSLLADWRRLNVAFTRAKCKLIVVGSGETLSSPLCARFLEVVKRRGWVLTLQPEDHTKFQDPAMPAKRPQQTIQMEVS